MAQSIEECLAAATDSVTLIDDVNDNGVEDMDQADINDMVQRNVDHLEIILAYEPDPGNESDETPDIKGSKKSKTKYNSAITAGKAYIESNS